MASTARCPFQSKVLDATAGTLALWHSMITECGWTCMYQRKLCCLHGTTWVHNCPKSMCPCLNRGWLASNVTIFPVLLTQSYIIMRLRDEQESAGRARLTAQRQPGWLTGAIHVFCSVGRGVKLNISTMVRSEQAILGACLHICDLAQHATEFPWLQLLPLPDSLRFLSVRNAVT